jgi:hypothetical protein
MAKCWYGGWKHVAAGEPAKTRALRITGSPSSAISILQPLIVRLQPVQPTWPLGVPSNSSGGSSLSDLCCAKLPAHAASHSQSAFAGNPAIRSSQEPSASQSTSFQGQFASSRSVKTTPQRPPALLAIQAAPHALRRPAAIALCLQARFNSTRIYRTFWLYASSPQPTTRRHPG